jgi:hypothetical protein
VTINEMLHRMRDAAYLHIRARLTAGVHGTLDVQRVNPSPTRVIGVLSLSDLGPDRIGLDGANNIALGCSDAILLGACG